MREETKTLKHFLWLRKNQFLPSNLLLEGEKQFLKKQQHFFLQLIICSQFGKCQPLCSDCRKITLDPNFFLEITSSEPTIKVQDILPLFSWSYNLSLRQKTKIYWINEAEKMTINASNKLLKFLEESPDYCFGILTTNNAKLLPPTIRSRLPLFVLSNSVSSAIAKLVVANKLSKEDELVLSQLNSDLYSFDNIFLKEIYLPAKTLLKLFFLACQKNNLEDFYFDLEKTSFDFWFFLELFIIYSKLALTDFVFKSFLLILEKTFQNLEKLVLFSCETLYQKQVFQEKTNNIFNVKVASLGWLSEIINNFTVF